MLEDHWAFPVEGELVRFRVRTRTWGRVAVWSVWLGEAGVVSVLGTAFGEFCC